MRVSGIYPVISQLVTIVKHFGQEYRERSHGLNTLSRSYITLVVGPRASVGRSAKWGVSGSRCGKIVGRGGL